jgi:UDP-N-acetylmuramyl pentapeptide phosphotransferase/UDP-N-acetylglucosamine-1-phosphate transferase
MGDKVSEFITKQSQQVFNILYTLLGITAIIAAIICGIMIAWAKDKPDKRRTWLKGLLWVFIGVVVAYASVGLINVIIEFSKNNEDFKPKTKVVDLVLTRWKYILWNSHLIYYG